MYEIAALADQAVYCILGWNEQRTDVDPNWYDVSDYFDHPMNTGYVFS